MPKGKEGFDVIVIGAGLAGLCCAGELVRLGARPLLISETDEVASMFKSPVVGGRPTIMHQPSRQVAWGGGWWFNLTRALDIPVRMYPGLSGGRVMLQGSGSAQEIPIANSASALMESIARMLPIPMEDLQGGMNRVLRAALAIPYQELATMDRVSMGQWLSDQRADELTTTLMLILGGCFSYMGAEMARDHLSVYACLGMIRSYLCGESEMWVIEPNAREGLCLPLAHAIEQHGDVWRGRRVATVNTDGGQVGAVVLEDGTEVQAPAVALAGGNARMGALLQARPPEVEACLRYDAEESPVPALEEFSIFASLDRSVDVNPRMFSFILGADLSLVQACWSVDAVAPWTVDAGHHTVVTEAVLDTAQIASAGGPEAVFAAMPDVTEELHPGYNDATVDAVRVHYRTWQTPFTTGPKMPRVIDTIAGLHFVGEGSAPTCGLYMEGAASAGVLGARAIRESARVS